MAETECAFWAQFLLVHSGPWGEPQVAGEIGGTLERGALILGLLVTGDLALRGH